MSTEEIEYFSKNVISNAEKKRLIIEKRMFKRELEDLEFESMMLRKYSGSKFYQRARDMTYKQLNERHWRVDDLIDYSKQEIEKINEIITANWYARECLESAMMPYLCINLKEEKLIQKELF